MASSMPASSSWPAIVVAVCRCWAACCSPLGADQLRSGRRARAPACHSHRSSPSQGGHRLALRPRPWHRSVCGPSHLVAPRPFSVPAPKVLRALTALESRHSREQGEWFAFSGPRRRKSTLCQIIPAQLSLDAGSDDLAGRSVLFRAPRRTGAGLETVYQTSRSARISLTHNMMLGLSDTALSGFIPFATTTRAAADGLANSPTLALPSVIISSCAILVGRSRQSVSIARSLAEQGS